MSLLRRTSRAWLGGIAATALLLFSLPHQCADAQSNSADNPGKAGTSKRPTYTLANAKSQLAHGDLQGAETSLWAVLGGDPNNEEALAMLGTIRGRQRRYPEAESLFRRVLQLNPKSVTGHRGLGNALVVQGKMPDAIEQYKAAEALAPQDVGVRVELAELYTGSGQFEEALTTLGGIPSSRLPLEGIPVKAAALLATGKKADAVRLIDQAQKSPATELDLAEVFVEGKLPDEALRCLEIASTGLKRRPARFYFLKGRALQLKGENQAAMSALQEGLKEDPKSADAFVALAELYSNENKHADAVAALEKARALAPDALPALRHLVVEATKAGNSKSAVEAASALAEKSPDNPGDLYLAGAALLQQNVQGASAVLEKYVALRSDNARAWLGLGLAYVQQDRYADARVPLERSIQLDPTLAEAEYQLGLVAKNEAKADEAIQHLSRAVQLQPVHAPALRTLGNLYLQSGQLDQSRDALERAEKIDPNNLQTEYDLGLVLNKMGKTELARQHMEQFRKLKDAQPPSDRQNP